MDEKTLQLLKSDEHTLLIQVGGQWSFYDLRFYREQFSRFIKQDTSITEISFEVVKLAGWCSPLLLFLQTVAHIANQKNIQINWHSLPRKYLRFLQIAANTEDSIIAEQQLPYWMESLARVGHGAVKMARSLVAIFDVTGKLIKSFARLCIGRADFRYQDMASQLRLCGPHIFPIVAILSLLVGSIVATVGGTQLALFDAQNYLPRLVAVSIIRDLGPFLAAIVVLTRACAFHTFELQSMILQNELNVLHMNAISPFDMLLLPRFLALVLMTPLVSLYAGFFGFLGGFLVGVVNMHVTLTAYTYNTQIALNVTDLILSVVKSVIFGFEVGVIGLFYGVKNIHGRDAIGRAILSTITSGIVIVIITDSMIEILLSTLGVR